MSLSFYLGQRAHRMLKELESRLVGQITDYERAVLRHGAVWFFLILCSYYVLRPIREQIGSTYGIQNLSMLFWATFAVMLIVIPLYAVLVGKFHRRRLVPIIYSIFIGCIFCFWVAMTTFPESSQIGVARAFFVWIGVFSLFVVSFFWSVVGDMLSTSQGRRIFGVMMGGGTVGQLIGSQLAGNLVRRIGVGNLLLIPAVLLVLAALVYLSMERACKRLAPEGTERANGKATGGNPFAGFTAVAKSRYLFSISLFVVLMALCGTNVYFQQSEIVRKAYAAVPFDEQEIPEIAAAVARERAEPPHESGTADRVAVNESDIAEAKKRLQSEASKEARTAYFANVNFAVSIVTLVFQFIVSGLLMRRFGVGLTLAVLPMAYFIGGLSLALSPTLTVLAIVTTLGRAAEYGICNPAREVLFTAIGREQRYKAKSFIDTVVRRAGDSSFGSGYQWLRESAGVAMTTLSWTLIPFAVIWAGLAMLIGKENAKLVRINDERDASGEPENHGLEEES